MTRTKVADLAVDELKGLIKEVVTQALSEVLVTRTKAWNCARKQQTSSAAPWQQ